MIQVNETDKAIGRPIRMILPDELDDWRTNHRGWHDINGGEFLSADLPGLLAKAVL